MSLRLGEFQQVTFTALFLFNDFQMFKRGFDLKTLFRQSKNFKWKLIHFLLWLITLVFRNVKNLFNKVVKIWRLEWPFSFLIYCERNWSSFFGLITTVLGSTISRNLRSHWFNTKKSKIKRITTKHEILVYFWSSYFLFVKGVSSFWMKQAENLKQD